MAGRNAEIAADIDNDGADGAAAHSGGDFLLGGQARETRASWDGLAGLGAPAARPAVRGAARVRRAGGWAQA